MEFLARRIDPYFFSNFAENSLQSGWPDFVYDSHFGNDLRGPDGAGLRQLSECVPEPLAGGRKHCQPPFALPSVRKNTHMVGESAASQLAGSARALPHVQDLDWLALSAGRAGIGSVVGFYCVEIPNERVWSRSAPSRALRLFDDDTRINAFLLASSCVGGPRCRESLAAELAYVAGDLRRTSIIGI